MHVKCNKENNTLWNRLSTFKKWGYRLSKPSKMGWVEPRKSITFWDLGLQDAQVPQHEPKMVPRCSPRVSKLSKILFKITAIFITGINEKRWPQGMGIGIWTCPWTNRWRWIALKALDVPKLKTQKSMKKDAPKAWELEYEHVHGQTDSAESRWSH